MTESLEKVTLNLYEGDWKRLSAIAPRAGASLIVRNLVRSFLMKIDEGANIQKETLDAAEIREAGLADPSGSGV